MLPARIVHRRERGFATPVGRWLPEDPGREARRLLFDAPALGTDLFARDYVEHLVDEHGWREADHTRKLFTLISPEHSARRFLDAPAGARPGAR